MANDKSKARLTIEISDSTDEKLEIAMRMTGATKATIVRTALDVYFKACTEVAQGGAVLLKKADGALIELMLPQA